MIKNNMEIISPNTEKILITGAVASGKTTLALQLSRETGLPLIELDKIVHPRDNSDFRRTPEDQREILKELDTRGCWIMEGTDRKHQRYLFDWADRIIYINPSLAVRKKRILIRFIKQILGREKCRYKPSLKLLRKMYVWTAGHERGIEEFRSFLSQYGDKVHYHNGSVLNRYSRN